MSNKVYKIFLWLGVAALLIFSPLVRGAVHIWSISFIVLTIGLLLFAWLWRTNNRNEYKFRRTKLDIPILFFVILAVISFIPSIYKYASFYALLVLLSYIGLFYLIVNNFDYHMMRRMIVLVIFVAGALSIYGLLQYFNILPHYWWAREFLASTYVNHNHFSGYLELVIPLTIGTLLKKGSATFFMKMILTVLLVAMIAAFIFAQSRGGWICLMLSLPIIVVFLRERDIAKKMIILFSFLIIVFGFSFFYITMSEVSQRLETVTGMKVGEASLQTRFKIWQGSLDMIKENPLAGTGVGTFVWGFSRFRPLGLDTRAHFAHNDYLHVASEMGVLAPIIMVWALAIIMWTGFVKKRYYLDIFGCTIGILALALHGLIDFNFHIPANMLLCVVFVAFIMSETNQKQEI